MIEPKEIRVESIIEKSEIPDVDFEINPYVGCVYQCIYCYARYIQDNSGHTEPWGEFVDVKINAADLIPQQTDLYADKEIFIGSITDPYLPCEKDYRLTRQILEKLVPLKPKLSIQTKSDLITRDIDLFKQFSVCETGLTITTLDDSIRHQIEGAAASVEERVRCLKKLHESGIATYVFIGPVLPELTDWKAIINETSSFTDYYAIEMLNIEGAIWNALKNWLGKERPELISRYESIFFSDYPLIKQLNRLSWQYLGYPIIPFHSMKQALYDEMNAFAKEKGIEILFNDLLYEG